MLWINCQIAAYMDIYSTTGWIDFNLQPEFRSGSFMLTRCFVKLLFLRHISLFDANTSGLVVTRLSLTAVLQGQDHQAFFSNDDPDPHVDDEPGLFQPATGKG